MADVGLFQVRSIYMSYPEWKNYEILGLPGLPGITEFGVQQFFAMRSFQSKFRKVCCCFVLFLLRPLFSSSLSSSSPLSIWFDVFHVTLSPNRIKATKPWNQWNPHIQDIHHNICHMFFYEFKIPSTKSSQHLMDDLDLPPDRANLFEAPKKPAVCCSIWSCRSKKTPRLRGLWWCWLFDDDDDDDARGRWLIPTAVGPYASPSWFKAGRGTFALRVFFWRNDKGMTYNGQSFLRL